VRAQHHGAPAHQRDVVDEHDAERFEVVHDELVVNDLVVAKTVGRRPASSNRGLMAFSTPAQNPVGPRAQPYPRSRNQPSNDELRFLVGWTGVAPESPHFHGFTGLERGFGRRRRIGECDGREPSDIIEYQTDRRERSLGIRRRAMTWLASHDHKTRGSRSSQHRLGGL